ncbi:MAG: thiamine-phosphate kinase [Verrucomicrobiota bacterium]|jgi:thiamine-monophosphate kinase
MNELELIGRLVRDLPTHAGVVVGAGDDCAVLDLGVPGRWVLFKTDAVVEGVHFLPDAPPEKIGHKALARCLSDVAAMAGDPHSAVVTLALPAGFAPGRIEAIYAAMNALARRYGVAIVGGETVATLGPMLISVALLGTVGAGRAVRRAGAQAGDALFVTGELGGSILGRHLEFEPRLAEARWLASHFSIHAMIDLSDGLAGDLRHLLAASGVGAELLSDAIPVSRAARERARGGASAKPPLAAALTDGEDFELLFAVASRDAVPLLDGWKAEFPAVRLSCIGKITAAPGLMLRDRVGASPLNLHGYAHFSQP